MSVNKDDIEEKINKNKKDLLDFASKLIEFETPDPPGKNTKEAQEWFAKKLEKMGMEVEMLEVFPDEPDVIGTLKGEIGVKTLVFNGHIDVAQVKKDEIWDFDPFEGTYDDKYLYGRGSTDMKGGLAAAYFAIKTLKDLGFRFKENIIFQTVIGEEAGEPGTKKALEKREKGDFAIIPEPNNLKIQGQGGVITLWVKIKSPDVYHDGARRKMIHAGGGIKAASTIEKAVKIIEGLQDLERHWAITKEYPGMPPGANTINPAVIEGGRHPAFVADECKIWYTIHFLPDEDVEKIKDEVSKHIKKIAESDVWLREKPPELSWGGKSLVRGKGEIFPSAEVDEDNPHVKLLKKTYKKTLNKEPEISTWPSVSDAGWFSKFDIPVVICGPGSIEDAHTLNEKVEIEQIVEASKLYANYIVDFCKD